jgi:hypothetical protein
MNDPSGWGMYMLMRNPRRLPARSLGLLATAALGQGA